MKMFEMGILLLSTVSFAVTITQNDWSSGAGVPGPVSDWGNSYSSSTLIDFTESTLKLVKTILSTPAEHSISSKNDGAITAFAADLDGDGDIDVISGAYMAESVTWWENKDALGLSWEEHVIDSKCPGSLTVLAADLDGDGDLDVLSNSQVNNSIYWYENTEGNASTWEKRTITGKFSAAWAIHTGDINGDGHVDVAATAAGGKQIAWWSNTDGSGTKWTKNTVTNSFLTPRSVYIADIDGDGYMDIAGAALMYCEVAWWRNTDGTGTSWEKHVVMPLYHAVAVSVADLDNDGDLDILGASVDAVMSWSENTNGLGTEWTHHSIDKSDHNTAILYLCDIDTDGDVDVIGAAPINDTMTCWLNASGDGSSWEKHIITKDFDSATGIGVADINLDGNLDLVGAAFHADAVTWWDCIGFTSGTLESSILDAGSVIRWDQYYSKQQEPSKTTTAFQFRSSSNPDEMGTWSDPVFSPTGTLFDILADSTQYLQYRVILDSADPLATPVLEEIMFTHGDLGIETSASTWALRTSSNPSRNGSFSVMISVPEPGIAEITLYDVAGRTVGRNSQDFSAGNHSVNFNELTEGVYFCVLGSENTTLTEKIIVLK